MTRTARLSTSGRRAAVAGLAVSLCACHNLKALPDGLSHEGDVYPAAQAELLVDDTWVDAGGERRVQQEIFDEVFRIVALAREFLVLDMFLYNDAQGPVRETTRALSEELTDALVAKKYSRPGMDIVVITDPVNELYGGVPSPHFARLRHAGVRVVTTDLDALRDSNPSYSFFWRLFVRPFGNAPGGLLPNPIGPGRVSLRTYLALLNFKANHRKTLIADSGDTWVGLVSSANPHDGSSAHRNVAVRFSGPAAADLLRTENAVLTMSGAATVDVAYRGPRYDSDTTVQVVTERKIKHAVLAALGGAGPGDRLDLYMFYLSDRDVVAALVGAHERGVTVRALLDPNKDAFGREKNGVPNRPVGYELQRAGVPVRWCRTSGEQCHAKYLLARGTDGRGALISGSANFTRRNLMDLNLETDVVVRGPASASVLAEAGALFEASWTNADGRGQSLPFAAWEDRSLWRRVLYRFMEWSGYASF